jgi:HlyD family secretion protein
MLKIIQIIQIILKHKFITGFIALAVIVGSYFLFRGGSSAEAKYVLAAVEKGTIVTSITGSGQVSASDQLDVKPKASGEIIYVGIKKGQEVRAGGLMAQLDSRDAQKAVRDAQISLESAKVQLQKLRLNQNNNLPKLENDILTAENNLTKTYEDAYNDISSIFLDLPDIIDNTRAILYDTAVGSSNQTNTGAYQNLVDSRYATDFIIFINSAENDYKSARNSYDKNFNDFKSLSRNSDREDMEKLIAQTLETTRLMSQAVKSEQNLLDKVVDNVHTYQPNRSIPSAISTYRQNISQYIGKINDHVSGLLNLQNSIINTKQSVLNSQQALDYNQQFNPLDLMDQENIIKQREAALKDAQDNLANYYIRAPFSGIVAEINMKKGDPVSSGTAIATIITKQRIAEISLNEIDIAKIKVGQKVTLTFDAVEGLTITGVVVDVDSLGTVSQGVVNYGVKIGFDTQDERVRPGMSVSAAIITDSKQNVLLVPNSAIKSQSGTSYVGMLDSSSDNSQLLASSANSVGILLSSAPRQQTIEIGLSNDSYTEVTGGLKEGDIVVARTITTSTITTSTNQNNLFQMGGRSTGGGLRSGTFQTRD